MLVIFLRGPMKPFYFILFYFNTVIICFILQIEQLHTQSDISAYICIYVYIYVYKLFYMSLLHSLLRFRVSFEQFDTDGHNRQPPTRVYLK